MADDANAKMERGTQAANLLGSTAFTEAMFNLRRFYMDAWLKAPSVEQREDCHKLVRLLDNIQADLSSTITTGTLTRQRIDALQGGGSLWSNLDHG